MCPASYPRFCRQCSCKVLVQTRFTSLLVAKRALTATAGCQAVVPGAPWKDQARAKARTKAQARREKARSQARSQTQARSAKARVQARRAEARAHERDRAVASACCQERAFASACRSAARVCM